jgi:hypothetical protein
LLGWGFPSLSSRSGSAFLGQLRQHTAYATSAVPLASLPEAAEPVEEDVVVELLADGAPTDWPTASASPPEDRPAPRAQDSSGNIHRICVVRKTLKMRRRGKDGDSSPPPAQIPACAANAPGSSGGRERGSSRRWPGRGRRTTTLMLPPGSRTGSKILQAAHQPRLGTLENQLISTNSSDEMLY